MSQAAHSYRDDLPDDRCRPVVALAGLQGTLDLALDPEPVLDPPPLHGEALGGADVVPIDAYLRRDLETWCRRFGQAVAEIVGGDRPVSQLVRWTAPDVYADLHRRAQIVARAGGHRIGVGRPRHAVRPLVRSAHVSFVASGVAEVALHVGYGERSRALAARFELGRNRWVCTALDFS